MHSFTLHCVPGGAPQDYIAKFRYVTLTTGDFCAEFKARFGSVPAVGGIEWDAWLYNTGAPRT